MKTLFLFDQCGCETPFFFEKEGDYSHLNGAYINSVDTSNEHCNELQTLLYDNDGELLHSIELLDKPTKDWDFFVIVGFIP